MDTRLSNGVVVGPHAYLWVNGTFPLAGFEVGELIRLRNFQSPRNNDGVFLVDEVLRSSSLPHTNNNNNNNNNNDEKQVSSSTGEAENTQQQQPPPPQQPWIRLKIVGVEAAHVAQRLKIWQHQHQQHQQPQQQTEHGDLTLCPELPAQFNAISAPFQVPVEGTVAVAERVVEAVHCDVACINPFNVDDEVDDDNGAMSASCCSGHGVCRKHNGGSIHLLPETRSAINDTDFGQVLDSGRGTGRAPAICHCEPSFCGEFCHHDCLPCAKQCSGHGTCDNLTGNCTCDLTWTDVDCGTRDLPCPLNCSNHGHCDRSSGKCECDATWGGVDCRWRSLPCPQHCSGHGTCDHHSGKCRCLPTWGGVDCNVVTMPCPGDCCAPAVCDHSQGRCECLAGSNRTGLLCCEEQPPCPCRNNPNSHGICEGSTGKCLCAAGWGGEACDVNICDHGALRKEFDRCLCSPDWFVARPILL